MAEEDRTVKVVEDDEKFNFKDSFPTLWVKRYEFARYVWQDWRPGSVELESLAELLKAIFM